MTLFFLRGIPVRMHPVLALYLGFALLTAARLKTLFLAFALVLFHETAHCLAAALLHVRVTEIALAPFGGVARMEGLELLPRAEWIVALAGPASNLLLAMAACLLCRLWPLLSESLAEFILLNLCLCLFNLLPAFPLDGGRILSAALTSLCGRRRALAVSAWLGVGLCAGMLCLGGVLFYLQGQINATLLVSGLYLGLCAARTLKERPFSRARAVLALEKQSLRAGVLPVRVLAVPQGTPAPEQLRLFTPGKLHYVVYLDEELRVTGSRWQPEIQRLAFSQEETPDISI